MTTFETIFDICKSGYTGWWLCPAFGLLFAAIGGLRIFEYFAEVHNVRPVLNLNFDRIFFWGGLVFAISGFVSGYQEHDNLCTALKTEQYKMLEGKVDSFISVLSQRTFSVNGVPFKRTSEILGYERTIHQGEYVRIAYVGNSTVGNSIIRLEIQKVENSGIH